ncbi:ABC transporter ATP-binding protein [Actinoalloteichus spitiensis]|uniref:ABC transporter ATP-binding protein n=1 Tax=Actinoalloteichus spitiensis TaxID=252394 RepID=UPI00035E589C|nr:ABC transporter ATP-binding protein [Actinoalloteichus spitiensis]
MDTDTEATSPAPTSATARPDLPDDHQPDRAGRPRRGEAAPRRSATRALARLSPYAGAVRTPLLVSTSLALLAVLAGLAMPLAIGAAIDGPVTERDLAGLMWMAGLVLLLGLVESGLHLARRRVMSGPTTAVEARMRQDLFHHLQRLPVSFHDRWPSGQLLSRAVNDLSTIRRFFAFTSVFIVVNAITILVGLAILFSISPVFALVMVVIGIPTALITLRIELRYNAESRLSQDQQGDLATTFEESVLGVRVLKSLGRGRHLARHFTAQARELRGTELRKIHLLGSAWLWIMVLPELGVAAMIAYGGYGVATGTMTVGSLVAAITILAYLRFPIDSMGWLFSEANEAATASDRYWEVRDSPRELADPAEPAELPRPVRGELRFEDVRFHYSAAGGADERAGGAEVLRGVDLTLVPGETMALVGATGCGKTTLTALASRLADPTGGRVTLDGVDLRDLRLADLRTAVTTAFEDPVLFSASVRENVRLGAPDATEEEVVAALRVAHALDFVSALPWGLDTRIGEQGLSLSGGQRQRLALARAVVGRPAVLVLDDPLSALDVHTEAEVEAALRRVLTGVTALLVAHRPSTVRLADRVALLEDGRVTAVGTHHELLASEPGYRALLATPDDEDGGDEVAGPAGNEVPSR